MRSLLQNILHEIKNDTGNGAAALAARALDALDCLASDTEVDVETLRRLATDIAELRPSMGAIGAQVLWVLKSVDAGDGKRTLPGEQLSGAVERCRRALFDANGRIADAALGVIGRGRRIVTCSCSGTVLTAMEKLAPSSVMLGDGHPLCDGVKAATMMVSRGIPATLSPDGAISERVYDADVVIVGADQVIEGGAVVNRAGTLPLALAAAHAGVPVYVLCQRIKLTGQARETLVLEHLPDGVVAYPPGMPHHSPMFDVTPSTLISTVVTEDGVMKSNEINALCAEAAEAKRKLFLWP